MGRLSARQSAIRALTKVTESRERRARIRLLFDEADSFEDDVDEFYNVKLSQVLSSRYYVRCCTYRKRDDRWKKLLHDNIFLSDTEFLANFRVTRLAFWKIVAFIQDDPAFQPAAHRPFRGGADLHLLVLLKFLGMSGNGNTSPNLALFFGLGKGTIDNYLRRVIKAIRRLQDRVVTWPDEDERRIISQRIKEQFDFPNCVGIVDGTLLPLASKPEKNGEDYYTRKGGYAVHALITCDDLARIRDVVVGWPGSVHDNRVWSNGRLQQHPEQFFRQNEYVLGDSAFQVSRVVVPAFKKPPKAELDPHRAYFNTKLAKIRIRSEHCIGLLKARFQYLKGIRARLKTKSHMKKIISYVMCASIIHNLLIGEPVPVEWESEIEGNVLEDGDELNAPIPTQAKGDERRKQLLKYLLELRG